MKIAILKYNTQNIGDDLQSLAIERLLPRVDLRLDRDDMSPARDWDDDVRLIVNGWFAPGMHRVWPPPGRARCLYISFHATEPEIVPAGAALAIGCRDPWTLGLCERRGVEGWISWCATLSLARPDVPTDGSILLVDVPEKDIERLPPEIAANAERVTHIVPPGIDRQAEARRLLERYARARWVVTTRLHALLPCAAMGTPVVFIRPPWSEHRYIGYTHLAWRIDNAPWSAPRPRVCPEIVRGMAEPLRRAVGQFIEE